MLFIAVLLATLYSLGIALEMPLTAREDAGYTRRAEPVTFGVTLPRGAVTNLSKLAIKNPRRQFYTLPVRDNGHLA